MSGYIYAIECAGRVKLGFSRKPELRFNKVASDAPFPCALLGYWQGSAEDELAVHNSFSSTRRHGEWFEASQGLFDFIERRSIRRHPIHTLTAMTQLAEHLISKGMTDAALAAKVGCDRSMITKIKRGNATPSLKLAAAISRETGLKIESLLPVAKPSEVAA